jgi:hypothetical protein
MTLLEFLRKLDALKTPVDGEPLRDRRLKDYIAELVEKFLLQN